MLMGKWKWKVENEGSSGVWSVIYTGISIKGSSGLQSSYSSSAFDHYTHLNPVSCEIFKCREGNALRYEEYPGETPQFDYLAIKRLWPKL